LRTQSIQNYLVGYRSVGGWGDGLWALMDAALIRKWTPEDDERLERLVAQGVSIVRAAAALKRKQAVVRARAAKFGTHFRRSRTHERTGQDQPTARGGCIDVEPSFYRADSRLCLKSLLRREADRDGNGES
jgi:hypothetical protein